MTDDPSAWKACERIIGRGGNGAILSARDDRVGRWWIRPDGGQSCWVTDDELRSGWRRWLDVRGVLFGEASAPPAAPNDGLIQVLNDALADLGEMASSDEDYGRVDAIRSALETARLAAYKRSVLASDLAPPAIDEALIERAERYTAGDLGSPMPEAAELVDDLLAALRASCPVGGGRLRFVFHDDGSFESTVGTTTGSPVGSGQNDALVGSNARIRQTWLEAADRFEQQADGSRVNPDGWVGWGNDFLDAAKVLRRASGGAPDNGGEP